MLPPDNCLHRIQCPQCGNNEEFKVEATSLFELSDNGTGDHEDVNFDENSFFKCDESECGFEGKMKDFTILHYEVETNTLCDGWVNCWTVIDGDVTTPDVYDTYIDAEDAIKDYIKDEIEAVESGEKEDSIDPGDLRVVRVWENGTREDIYDAEKQIKGV